MYQTRRNGLCFERRPRKTPRSRPPCTARTAPASTAASNRARSRAKLRRTCPLQRRARTIRICDIHDLQEPLQMVTANTQLLAENYRGRLDENADKFIRNACEGAHRMQSLIQDLLARSPAGRTCEICGPVDCNAVLDEILKTMAPSLEQSGVITHGALPVLPGDRSQLLQVFQNLIGNALQFRGKESPAISVQAERSGDQWEFT